MNALVDPTFPVAAAIAVLAGLVRGFSGFGSAMIMVPSLSALYTPQIAIPMLAMLELAMGLQLLPRALRHLSVRTVGFLAAGAVVGLPLGAMLLIVVPAEPMRWAISVLILAALALLLFGVGRKGVARPRGTLVTGGLSGLTAGATGMGGPPVVLYFLAGRDTAASIRATLIGFFLFTSAYQGGVYALNGLLSWELALRGLLLFPLFALGAVGGSRMFDESKERTYRRIAMALVAAVAILSLVV